MFQKLPHFGEYQKQREKQLSQLYKDCKVTNEITLHHSGAATDNTQPDTNFIGTKNCENRIPKIKDIIGRALPRIGAYKKLDNTKQVVALIDDVRNFFKNFFQD